MKKRMAAWIAVLMLLTALPITVSAADPIQAVKEKADTAIRLWLTATEPLVPGSQEPFEGWTADNFNFQGTITPANQRAVLLYAWYNFLFMEPPPPSGVLGDPYHLGWFEWGIPNYSVPEKVLLDTVRRYACVTTCRQTRCPFTTRRAVRIPFSR